ncbi:MAG: DUF3500 domain-containing protein [Planctomycetota bacterium]
MKPTEARNNKNLPTKHLLGRLVLILCLFMPILVSSFPGSPTMKTGVQIPAEVASGIAHSANSLLNLLGEKSKQKIHQPALPGASGSEALSRWTYFPGERPGLRLDEMTAQERVLAQKLVRSSLSDTGHLKWNAIIALEDVLRSMSRAAGGDDPSRNPGQYTFAIFGDPMGESPWGWRVEGHHISLKFLLDGDTILSSTPAFLGAAPTVPMMGPNTGTEILDEEEDLALALARSLAPAQREIAIQQGQLPRDVVTGPGNPGAPENVGIRRDQLDPSQKILLDTLIVTHLGLMKSAIATAEKARIFNANQDEIRFAWWGLLDKGLRHSYRIHGPTFVVELVKVAADPGHVHIVRRDPQRDLDGSPLLDHLRQAHGK